MLGETLQEMNYVGAPTSVYQNHKSIVLVSHSNLCTHFYYVDTDRFFICCTDYVAYLWCEMI